MKATYLLIASRRNGKYLIEGREQAGRKLNRSAPPNTITRPVLVEDKAGSSEETTRATTIQEPRGGRARMADQNNTAEKIIHARFGSDTM